MRTIDINVIAIQGRVALGLLAAETVLPRLERLPELRTHAAAALRADWSWLETRLPDPSKLYWDYMPSLFEHDSRLGGAAELQPLHCCLFAHSYAIWSAEGVTNLEQPGTSLSIGNDISDVDESYLTRALELAVQLAPDASATERWLDNLIARMERECAKRDGDPVGPRMRRGAFALPAQ